ncbi:MAG: heterodisulfide reductase-related iron-sulfur binding cluster [Ferrimicrobium sp.]
MLLAIVETRRIFAGETPTAKVVFYLLSLVVIVVFLVGVACRWRRYSAGRRTASWHWRTRRQSKDIVGVTEPPSVTESLLAIAGNTTVTRRKHGVGVAHLLVFWGFIGLFLATSILSLDYDILGNVSRFVNGHTYSFFRGSFYLAYNAVFDAAGLLALVGVILLAARRWFSREPELRYRRAQEPKEGYSRWKLIAGDQVFLLGLLLIIATGILIQGLRIDGEHFPSFERWTWFGWFAGQLWLAVGVGAATARSIHGWMWWVHVGLALGFVAYLPWSKALHMLSAPANLIVRSPASVRCLPASPEGKVGYGDLSDFTPKEFLGFDSCTKCGRCHSVCPARTAGAPLSPRDFILDLRQWSDRCNHIPIVLDTEVRSSPTGPLAREGSVAGSVILSETLWACTTCMACVEVCPVGIEHIPTIVQLRRSLVDSGEMEPMLQGALQNISTQGNSFGKSARMRARWTKGLDFQVVDARKESVDYLWFVGDFASFDDRLTELSRTFAQVLNTAGVSFGILYEDEYNAGNDVRRVGEEGLFEMLVEKNLASFAKAEFSTIVTTDPHSYNTLRNEYPSFGLEVPVMHYTELLAKLLFERKVSVRPLNRTVTYHDPCYLGRYNRMVDTPRAVLTALGCEIIEMPRHGFNSFCCGAGGGRIWMDDSQLSERPSENRMREAGRLDVSSFVVACPKDFAMFSAAVTATGQAGEMQVVDIVQLFQQAMQGASLVGVEP